MEHSLNRQVIKWGNGAGVLLPREYVGQEAKIILIDRSSEINKEVFSILQQYLPNLLGIYLVGSYARGEQTENSDIDIIAISDSLKKEIHSGKYNISITPIESIRKTLEKHPILVYPRLLEAKSLLNNSLLEELKKTSPKKSDFNSFIEDTKRIIKIDNEFLELDSQEGDYLKSYTIVYSTILRLRGILIIKCILEKKSYTNKLFKSWLLKYVNEKVFEDIYSVYQIIKEDKKPNSKIKIEDIKKLTMLLENEVKHYGK
jgi:predicted nucleotidyltransferase